MCYLNTTVIFFLSGSHSYKSRYYASFLRIRSKTLFFPITQNTHDFVSTSVRRIHNTDDVVMSSYRRWNNVLCLLGNSRIKDGIFPISLLRQTEQKYRGLSVFDTHSDNELKRLVSIIIEKKITTLQRKCQNLEFFLPIFFYIPTEFLRLQSKYAYSVRMRENSVRDTFNAV